MAAITIETKVALSTLKPSARMAFKGNDIYRVEVHSPMTFFKLTHSGGASPRGEIAVDPTTGFATPWWFSYESWVVPDRRYGTVAVRGVADVAENVSRTRTSFTQYLRSRGAVCHDWNVMTHLLIIELSRSVVGLMGTCSGQPVFHDTGMRSKHDAMNISFIGGEQQFFVPGLRRSDLIVRRFGPCG